MWRSRPAWSASVLQSGVKAKWKSRAFGGQSGHAGTLLPWWRLFYTTSFNLMLVLLFLYSGSILLLLSCLVDAWADWQGMVFWGFVSGSMWGRLSQYLELGSTMRSFYFLNWKVQTTPKGEASSIVVVEDVYNGVCLRRLHCLKELMVWRKEQCLFSFWQGGPYCW